MSDFAIVFGLALLPALGNFSGGLLAEYLPTSKRNLNRALHAASGIVSAIVAVELAPHALQATSGWVRGAALGVGGLLRRARSARRATAKALRWRRPHQHVDDLCRGCRGPVQRRADNRGGGFVLFTLVSAGLGGQTS